jgi:hypothetical protein
MQQRTSILSAFTLSTAMAFGAASMAADLPKEGKYKGTASGYGTFKSIPVGKERVLTLWDDNDLTLTDGFFDHMAWHCFGTGDIIQGVEQDQGYCVGTDTAGDQVIQTVMVPKHPSDAPSYDVSLITMYGTGKYTGISGTEHDKCHNGEFKTPEGAYLLHCEIEGTYKLPQG